MGDVRVVVDGIDPRSVLLNPSVVVQLVLHLDIEYQYVHKCFDLRRVVALLAVQLAYSHPYIPRKI